MLTDGRMARTDVTKVTAVNLRSVAINVHKDEVHSLFQYTFFFFSIRGQQMSAQLGNPTNILLGRT